MTLAVGADVSPHGNAVVGDDNVARPECRCEALFHPCEERAAVRGVVQQHRRHKAGAAQRRDDRGRVPVAEWRGVEQTTAAARDRTAATCSFLSRFHRERGGGRDSARAAVRTSIAGQRQRPGGSARSRARSLFQRQAEPAYRVPHQAHAHPHAVPLVQPGPRLIEHLIVVGLHLGADCIVQSRQDRRATVPCRLCRMAAVCLIYRLSKIY